MKIEVIKVRWDKVEVSPVIVGLKLAQGGAPKDMIQGKACASVEQKQPQNLFPSLLLPPQQHL